MISSVKIADNTYSVEEVKGPLVVDNASCRAVITYEENKIEVLQNLPEDKKKRGILHEIVHGIIRDYNLDPASDEKEYFVDMMALGLNKLIQENPKLIEFIQNDNKTEYSTWEMFKIISENNALIGIRFSDGLRVENFGKTFEWEPGHEHISYKDKWHISDGLPF